VTTPTSSDESADPAIWAALPAGPWARVSRIQLIHREIRETLSASAVEVLFAQAEHVFEGSPELGTAPEDGSRRLYATLMVTIDLGRCVRAFREPLDAATAVRLGELMSASRPVSAKLDSLARAEVARLAGVAPSRLHLELEHKVHADGATVLIDVDVMASVPEAR
jgi:hypothetical protein